MQRSVLLSIAAALLLSVSALVAAQAPKPAQGRAPTTPRTAAAFDMTGYWVSEVTEKWRFRMLVPDKGDYTQVPLNPEGRKIANAWDPAKDEAAGEACRAYGAAALQVPGRLHITWQDDNTLRLDTDSGTQTRLLRFGSTTPPNGAPTWQGIRSQYGAALIRGIAVMDREDRPPMMRATSSSRGTAGTLTI